MAKLYFYYSAMNAGKSTILLQSNFNYQERGMDTLLYAPALDDRYGVGKISSRIGLQSSAHIVEKTFDIFEDVLVKKESLKNLACVLVDEAHFLSKNQVSQLCRVVDDLGIPVLCYGIRTDFLGEPFEGSHYLLAWADCLSEVKTVCHCGKKATMNMRIDSSGRKIFVGEQIQIGGNELYVATCRSHFYMGVSRIEDKSNLS